MKVKKIICMLTALVISGCAHSNKLTTKHFTPTESICIDGVMANIDAAGCEKIVFVKQDGVMGVNLRCFYIDQTNPWTFFSFHIMDSRSTASEEGWNMVCSDPVSTVYISRPIINSNTD